MEITEKIKKKLELIPGSEQVIVSDDSAAHAGHVGVRPDGETHFTVTVVSDSFTGLPRIERHRLVYAALSEELSGGIHALAINAIAPNETNI